MSDFGAKFTQPSLAFRGLFAREASIDDKSKLWCTFLVFLECKEDGGEESQETQEWMRAKARTRDFKLSEIIFCPSVMDIEDIGV